MAGFAVDYYAGDKPELIVLLDKAAILADEMNLGTGRAPLSPNCEVFSASAGRRERTRARVGQPVGNHGRFGNQRQSAREDSTTGKGVVPPAIASTPFHIPFSHVGGGLVRWWIDITLFR